MSHKVDMRKVDLAQARHDRAEDAFEEWEYAQIERIYAHDYDESYPVVSRPNQRLYEKQFRRSQQVTLGSRTIVDE